jgi:hypothetical protein
MKANFQGGTQRVWRLQEGAHSLHGKILGLVGRELLPCDLLQYRMKIRQRKLDPTPVLIHLTQSAARRLDPDVLSS